MSQCAIAVAPAAQATHPIGAVAVREPNHAIIRDVDWRAVTEHATAPEFVYVHKWQLHDFVMWDNRQVLHRVRRYDNSQPRDMRRTTVAGEAMTAQQAA